MREGLMDDCGYHGLDECRNYETCTEEAYNKGYADAVEEFAMWLYEDKGWLKELNTFEYWSIDSHAKIKQLIREYEKIKEKNNE